MSKGSKRGVAMLAALVTLLTSCSAGDTSAAVSERELPLATYDEYQEEVSVLFNTDDELIRSIEEQVAVCMKEGGFEYVPFAEQYTAEPPPSDTPTSDRLEESLLRTSSLPTNPNDAIVAALDPATERAYLERLWGTSDEISMTLPEDGVDSMDLSVEAVGCQNYAAIELTGGREGYEYETTLLDLATRLDERVAADRRVVRAHVELEDCKTAAGYHVANEEFEELLDAVALLDPDVDRRSFDASMVELRDLERASSAIANDCEAELDLDAVVADVRRDLFHEVAGDY